MIVALVVLVPLAGLAAYRWWPRRPRPSDSLAVEREATLRQIASLQRGRDLATGTLTWIGATDVTEGEPGISNDPSARVTPWAVTSPSVATPLTDARPVGDSTAGRPLPARSATSPSCFTCGDKGWISAPGEACSFLERVVPCPFCDGPGPGEAA